MKKQFSNALLIAASLLCFSLTSEAFTPTKATYNGLFFETNGDWQQSAGFITIATTSRGTYSAKILLGSSRYSFSGSLDENGSVSREILRFRRNPLEVHFQVDPEDEDLITGSVSDGVWEADLYADRAVFNGKTTISPDAGRYTMAFLGDFTSTNNPGGASYGTINVDKAGRLFFSSSLGDGSRVFQTTTVSKNGQWPLYIPLYWGGGALYGWQLFNSSVGDDLAGDLTWIKPEITGDWYYPSGFALINTVTGSRYVPPPRGSTILDLSSATIEFNGGNLDRGITNHVTIDSKNQVHNLSANGLRLTFSVSTGSFSGQVMDAITWDWIPFRGVVLQNINVGVGYFLGWDQTGEVWLQSE
jgi:hypothetical protein